MWEMELKNKSTSEQGKVVNPVGSLENWYTKANQYWEVKLPSMRRKLKPLTMECWVDTEI